MDASVIRIILGLLAVGLLFLVISRRRQRAQ
jgi:LPXTG-motif cell wall-anchored protein